MHLTILVGAGLPFFAAVALGQVHLLFRPPILIERLVFVLAREAAEKLPAAKLGRMRQLVGTVVRNPLVHLLLGRLGLGSLTLYGSHLVAPLLQL